MGEIKIIYKALDELKPYKNNPRKNDEAVELVENSIKEFGFKVPIIIDKDGEIIAGHTRYKAAKRLRMDKVPCIVAEDLTEEQIKAYRLADNKVSEKAQWDNSLLNLELDGILDIDMESFGFDLFGSDEEEYIEPEVEFSEVLGEEHNYIVLYFDNEVDWLQAETLFDLKPVKCGSTRRDKNITKSMERIGVGRVLKGAEALNKIMEKK